ncbi:isoleucine patch superfamily enzyme, carbonic anhydrase/acetyltransferase [Synechococcus sp. PCC 7502]|uniref:gamma carbonic anhydrase family protein n=1 Tax=Synechococcus sp. PCC 7502 TaxID=1173263 RepID=UPI00029FC53A|nr:gamma carbonic anhydrase family protein [Synechococcus sp. PCC 7502]AFY74181.1 isoleucine patch superfamily enzyme, carbonic anhydrase/acetyltransferase [Synechococcus sp. PCC 7502]
MFAKVDISQSAFIATDAVLVGDIKLEIGSSVWYKAVIRADLNSIQIGAYSNIQDGAILHGDVGKPLVIEEYVTVGHNAVIHGLTIGRGSLIGIGAIILEGVSVGAGSIVGAGAVVTKDVADGIIVAGIPAKPMRSLSSEEQADLIIHAQKYYKLALYHAGKATDKGF